MLSLRCCHHWATDVKSGLPTVACVILEKSLIFTQPYFLTQKRQRLREFSHGAVCEDSKSSSS